MAKNFIMRLDDACEKRNIKKWNRMEELLDEYGIKPIVGIIPNCQDKDMEKYPIDLEFWYRAANWQDKGWLIALHGYSHVFYSNSGGLNPVNSYSEFAGVSVEEQKEKIKAGVEVLEVHGLNPKIFFAPAHTYDDNTIEALKVYSNIRIISDTIANDIYCGRDGLTYIPQQSGRVRELPFKTVTFCYHPNIMQDADFELLETFLKRHKGKFLNVPLEQSNRKLNWYDKLLEKLYFARK
jgi:predicted deacetylase